MVQRKVILTSADADMNTIYAYFEFWHSTPLGMFIGISEKSGEVKVHNIEDWIVRFEEW